MTKTSIELTQKAAGFMLAAANAAKREANEKKTQTKIVVTTKTVTTTKQVSKKK
jgi:hypothetical protein